MNKYRIEGSIAVVEVTGRGGVTLEVKVDADDIPLMMSTGRRWWAVWDRRRSEHRIHGQRSMSKRSPFLLSRFLMDAPAGLVIDHINHDPLDNRRSNLRLVTAAQNQQNRRGPDRDSTTGIRGVHFDKRQGQFVAYLTAYGKRRHLGYFDTAAEAEVAAINGRRHYMTHSEDNAS